MFYTHVGYLLGGDKAKNRFQPYIALMNHSYDATSDNRTQTKLGINMFMSGHNSKLTLEYVKSAFGDTDASALMLQAMIYL